MVDVQSVDLTCNSILGLHTAYMVIIRGAQRLKAIKNFNQSISKDLDNYQSIVRQKNVQFNIVSSIFYTPNKSGLL